MEAVSKASPFLTSAEQHGTLFHCQASSVQSKLDSFSAKLNNANPAARDAELTPEQIARRDKNMVCDLCGKKGHRAANCPDK